MFGKKDEPTYVAGDVPEEDVPIGAVNTMSVDADFATMVTPNPEDLPEETPIGVDPVVGIKKDQPVIKKALKPVRKGSLYCFVAMFLIAASVLAAMICLFTTKGLTLMADVTNIVILIPQVLAYAYVSIPAFAWVSHRGKGTKIAYWIAFVVIFACLVAQLGWYIGDIAERASSK